MTSPRRRRFSARLVEAHEILGLFLDLDVAVADDAEGAVADQVIAREQLAEERADGVFEADEADRGARQADEARQHRRQHQQRAQQLVVRLAAQLEDQAEALVGDERERVRRIDGLGREHREDLLEEMPFQPLPLGGVSAFGGDDVEIDARQLLDQRAPDPLLRLHQLVGAFGDGGELLRRGQAFGAERFDAGAHLAAQAGDAHHEEFIEVVARDRQEAQPFEQRMGRCWSLPPAPGR